MDNKKITEIKSIIPAQVFDAHAHIYRMQDLHLDEVPSILALPEEATIDYWKRSHLHWFENAEPIGGLFFPFPTLNCDFDAANTWLIQELAKHPDSRGLLLVGPKSDPQKMKEYLKCSQIVGFKPYHRYAQRPDTFAAGLDEYLPQWTWPLADAHGLAMMIHLVKANALAHKDNTRQLRSNCLKYPNAKAILAHAARGFQPQDTVDGIGELAGLHNVYFDTSAICEPLALYTILKEFGITKLCWGSDFPISEEIGKCIGVGEGFSWLDATTVDWDKHPHCKPISFALETLRALKEAGDYFGLNQADYQKIFCDNAMKMLNIKPYPTDSTSKLYEHAKTRIPGGTQLLGKRPERYAPGQWPAYFSEARGCEVWDLDGKHYYDLSTNGIGACLLGFRDPDVTAAVTRRINLGAMCTLSPPEEVELADALCEIHPWADQARFTRCGGESAVVAIRTARATTNRSMIAVCGYHGWHDWYLAANLGESDALDGHLLPGLNPRGVPKELAGTTLTFKDQRYDELDTIIKNHGDNLAAVIMEPARHHDPESGWLPFVRKKTRECGALLIFDEITIGFRLNHGGIHLKFGIHPDMAIFAKSLGNGHPIGAIIGSKEAMQGAQQSFISSTYWTEGVGPTAALATINKMKSLPNFHSHLAKMGTLAQNYWRDHARKHHLPVEVEDGYPALSTFKFNHELAPELTTLYTQLMLERGFLAANVIYTTMGLTEGILALYGQAVEEVFGLIREYLNDGTVKKRLKGPVAESGFARLTK